MPNPKVDQHLIRMLSERLERISADSVWAHRASGVRGALLRQIEKEEKNLPSDAAELRILIALGFRILEKAAAK
jgi:hypothetical protein